MKKIKNYWVTAFLICFYLSTVSNAQDSTLIARLDSVSNELKALKDSLANNEVNPTDSLKVILQQILNDDESTSSFSRIYQNNITYPVIYKHSQSNNDIIDKSGFYFYPDSVQILVREGLLEGIRAYGKEVPVACVDTVSAPRYSLVVDPKGTCDEEKFWKVSFYDSDVNLSLNHMRNENKIRKKIRIYNTQNDKEFIKINNLITYENELGKDYSPNDEVVTVTRDIPSAGLEKSVGLNSHLSVRVFSDFLGLISSESNGILQTEVSSKIDIWKTNISRKPVIFLFPYIEPTLTYSKFDTGDDSIIRLAGSDTLNSKSDLFDVYQRAYLNLGLNIYPLKMKFLNTYIEVFGGASYSYAEITQADSSTVDVNFSTLHMGARFNVLQFDNFGFNFTPTWSVSESEPLEGVLTKNRVSTAVLDFELFYYPIDDASNYIYARFRSHNPLSKAIDAGFSQVQIGYKTNLKF